jgi:hypothetical protein
VQIHQYASQDDEASRSHQQPADQRLPVEKY